MKLGIVVNGMRSEEVGATTHRLAVEAISMGHEVWGMSAGNLAYNPDNTIGAWARSVPAGRSGASKFEQQGSRMLGHSRHNGCVAFAQQPFGAARLGAFGRYSFWKTGDATWRPCPVLAKSSTGNITAAVLATWRWRHFSFS